MNAIVSRPGVDEGSIREWHDPRPLVSRVGHALFAAAIIRDEASVCVQSEPIRALGEESNGTPVQRRAIALSANFPIRADVQNLAAYPEEPLRVCNGWEDSLGKSAHNDPSSAKSIVDASHELFSTPRSAFQPLLCRSILNVVGVTCPDIETTSAKRLKAAKHLIFIGYPSMRKHDLNHSTEDAQFRRQQSHARESRWGIWLR